MLARYTDLPFPTLQQLDGRSPEAAWNKTMGFTEFGREWQGLYHLNASIVGGATDPYRIALAVEEYLRSRYTYSLKPPETDYASPYAAFLFKTKTGYCQHFAGAMAVLLRFNGIPARVAVGFTTGEKVADGTYIVTRNDAHAWVEAYFPGVGWVPFDPTPGRALPVSGDAPTSGPDAAIAGQNLPGASATATPAGAAGPRGHDRNPAAAAAASSSRRPREVQPGSPGRRRLRCSSSGGPWAARCFAGAACAGAALRSASPPPWRSSTPI